MLGGGIVLYDYSSKTTTEAIWAAQGGTMIFFGLTQLLWFHEFYHGGPDTTDLVYGEFNQAAFRSYVLYGVFAIVAYFMQTTKHPVSVATNAVTLIFGMAITYLIKGNKEDRDAEWTRYEEQVAEAERIRQQHRDNNKSEESADVAAL